MHSEIHSHRFGFTSRVLVGSMISRNFAAYEPGYGGVPEVLPPTHVAYLHEGPRRPSGNRPWVRRESLWVAATQAEQVNAGEEYHMLPYAFHATQPGNDGLVATVMTKTSEYEAGSRSLCEIGVKPDEDFDRFQLPAEALWDAVHEVLSSSGV